MPYTKGNASRSTFLVGPESHKLMLEFEADDNIKVGMPCKMHADGGKVSPCIDDEPEKNIVGISIHDGSSAYGEYVVLATRGYAVIRCKSEAAITPGPVTYVGYSEGYNLVKDVANDLHHFGWALDAADEAGVEIRVLVKD